MKIDRCPLCGGKSSATKPQNGPTGPWNIACGRGNQPGCGLVLFGDSGPGRDAMVRRWNTRAAIERTGT